MFSLVLKRSLINCKITCNTNMETTNSFSKFLLIVRIFITLLLAALLFSCKKNAETAMVINCGGTQKSFATDIKPIVESSCSMDSDCHGSGSTSGPGELLTYAQIFNARNNIHSAVASGVMPKDATLSATDKNAILCWIENGAANN